MAVFAYTYYWSYISKPEVTLGDVLNSATKLNDHDQILLVGKMANLLAAEGLIPGEAQRQQAGTVAAEGGVLGPYGPSDVGFF